MTTEKWNNAPYVRRDKTATHARLLSCLSLCTAVSAVLTIISCFAGIVSSNTRDLAAKVTYPHLNFSIPVTVFHRLLQRYEQTKNVNVFRVLNSTEKEVKRVWRLQGAQSKL